MITRSLNVMFWLVEMLSYKLFIYAHVNISLPYFCLWLCFLFLCDNQHFGASRACFRS